MSKTPSHPKKLLPRQEKFCQAYIEGGCLNGTQSAKQSGSRSPRNYASDNLKLPHVQARIEKLKKERRERVVKAVAKASPATPFEKALLNLTPGEVEQVRREVTKDTLTQRMVSLFMSDGIMPKDAIEAGKTVGKWMGMEGGPDGKSSADVPADEEVYVAAWLRKPAHNA